jgi:hypothetical protein
VRLRARQIVEMKTRLEEEIRMLEEEKSVLSEEVGFLKRMKSKP